MVAERKLTLRMSQRFSITKSHVIILIANRVITALSTCNPKFWSRERILIPNRVSINLCLVYTWVHYDNESLELSSICQFFFLSSQYVGWRSNSCFLHIVCHRRSGQDWISIYADVLLSPTWVKSIKCRKSVLQYTSQRECLSMHCDGWVTHTGSGSILMLIWMSWDESSTLIAAWLSECMVYWVTL